MDDLILQRYRIIETINTGGFGTVYVAWDERIRRRVAIKECSLAASPTLGSGLEEARTAALLNHPNIVSVYDVEVSGPSVLTIMEYVDGVTLGDIPSDDLDDDVIAAVVKAVGAGLAFAHKNGVLHLDIKPANILINKDGFIKIADFGMSRLSGSTGHGNAEGGTLGYMPLEQLSGSQASTYTDQWAFAALIYELCTDEFPYADAAGPGCTVEQMLKAQQESDPALLLTDNDALNDVLKIALSRETSERHPSIKALTDDLLECLGNPTVGRKELRMIVEELSDDTTEPDRTSDTGLDGGADGSASDTALWLKRSTWTLFKRATVALPVGWIVWRSFSLSTTGEWYIPIAVSLAIACLTAASSVLGPALGILAVGTLFIISGNYGAGALGLIILVPWWLFIGRLHPAISWLGFILVGLALESNIFAYDLLAETFPQLFGDNIVWVDLSLAGLFILMSIVGVLLSRRRGFGPVPESDVR